MGTNSILSHLLSFSLTALLLTTAAVPANAQSIRFVRGDADANGTVDLTDAIVTLNAIFQGQGELICMDAADANDDGVVDVSDAVKTLLFKFLGGDIIPDPGADSCGSDPTADGLGCESFPPCPTSPAPTKPNADAGPDQTVRVGETVTLDGRGSSDVDGDLLTFSWSFIAVPDGSTANLSNPTAVNPTFTADLVGTYVVSLVVNDGIVDSPLDTVTVTAAANAPPTIGNLFRTITKFDYDDFARLIGATTTIIVSASDPDGDPLVFTWSASSGSISFVDGTATWRRDILFGRMAGGIVTVTVSDGRGGMDSLTIRF